MTLTERAKEIADSLHHLAFSATLTKFEQVSLNQLSLDLAMPEPKWPIFRQFSLSTEGNRARIQALGDLDLPRNLSRF